jgi:hypothetical protein
MSQLECRLHKLLFISTPNFEHSILNSKLTLNRTGKSKGSHDHDGLYRGGVGEVC